MLLLRSLAAGALFVCFAIASTSPLRRHIEILNDSGRKVVVQWINPSTGELVRFSDPYLYNGASLSFDSYINHSFIFQEVLANETACSEITGSCRATQMTVRDSDDQGRGTQKRHCIMRSIEFSPFILFVALSCLYQGGPKVGIQRQRVGGPSRSQGSVIRLPQRGR